MFYNFCSVIPHTQKKSQDISLSEKLALHNYVVTTSLKAKAFSSGHLKLSLASNKYYLSKLLLFNRSHSCEYCGG